MSANTAESHLAVLPPAALARQVDHALWNALAEIYDGASPEKLGIVLDYCKARQLDPLKKPVHIVSTWSQKQGKMVETIWPSISETRITAMRTGNYAGMDECKFGPTIRQKVGNTELDFPEWAQITLHRIIRFGNDAKIVPFAGPKVYWIESYASKGKDPSPNTMWAKRTWGQLEKCAEAGALRRAFPEETGSLHTAEEMEGRTIHEDEAGIQGAAAGTGAEAGTPAAGEAGTGEPGAAGGQPKVKRARVPLKGASATATPAASTVPPGGNGVVVEGEVTETKAAEVASAAVVVEPAAAAPVEAAKPADPAPAAAPAAPAEAATGYKPKYPQVEGWPLTIEATIEEVSLRDMLVEDLATGEKTMMKANLVTLGGTDVAKHKIPSKVAFDPLNKELNAKAKKGEAVMKLTLEAWPSQSRPGTSVLVATHGEDVDIM